MSLTKNQQEYIRKNYQSRTLNQISKHLQIEMDDLKGFLKDELSNSEWEKYRVKHNFKKKKEQKQLIKRIKNFDFQQWLNHSRFQLIIIVLLTVIAYINIFDNEFLSDDIRVIVNQPNITDFSYVTTRFPHLVRPLLYFTAASLFGKTAFPFHLINFSFHLGVVLLVFLLVNLLHNKTTALITSCLVAVHPIMTEAVTWISGGVYLTYSFFILAAFLAFLLGYKNKKFKYLSIIIFGISLITVAQAMVYPFILTSFLLFWPELKFKNEWKKLIVPWSIGLVGIVYAATKIPQRLQSLRVKHYQNPHFLNPLRQVPTAVSKYLELIVWPKALTLYHSEISLIGTPEFVIRVIAFLIFAGIGIYTFFKNKKVFFWFTFFGLALGPMLTPFGVSWLVAERYVYLGAIGIFVLFAWLINQLNNVEQVKNIPLYIFLGLILPSLTVRTIVRNNAWQNQDNLWFASAKYSPHSAQNHNNLGDLYGRHKQWDKSIKHFKRAIELQPGYADAMHNVANIYWQKGDVDQAIEYYQEALKYNPMIWQSHQNLAAIYLQQEEFDKAKEHLEKLLELNPNHEKGRELLNRLENN